MMQKLSVHDGCKWLLSGFWTESAPTCAHRLIIKTISYLSVFAVFADKFPGNDPVQSIPEKAQSNSRQKSVRNIQQTCSDGGGNTFSKSTNRLV